MCDRSRLFLMWSLMESALSLLCFNRRLWIFPKSARR